jgi:hypothetical protein
MISSERYQQICRLIERAQWPELWQLAGELPLADAAATVHRSGGGWRPVDAAGRRLFERLAVASPEMIMAAAAEPISRVRLGRGDGKATAWFTPDDWHAAVLTPQGLEVHALQAGRPAEHFDTPGRPSLHKVEVLDDGAVWVASSAGTWRIVRQGRGRTPEVLSSGHQFPLPCLVSQPSQFIVGERAYSRLWYEIKAGRRPGQAAPQELLGPERGSRLWLGTLAGSGLREVWLRDLGFERGQDRITHLAVEPMTGHLAVLTEVTQGETQDLTVLDTDLQIVGRAKCFGTTYQTWVKFCGPDCLVTWDYREVRSWRAGPPLTAVAVWPGDADWAAVVSSLGEAAVRTMPWLGLTALHKFRSQELTWLDTRKLTPADAPPGLPASESVITARSGECAAIVQSSPGELVLAVHDLRFAQLLTRPLADAFPADLATVRDVEASGAAPEVKQVAELLRKTLEYRFGTNGRLSRLGRIGRAMPAGSRPASSQPRTVAASGMPTPITSRFVTGMLVSKDRVHGSQQAG